jgi:cytochrome c
MLSSSGALHGNLSATTSKAVACQDELAGSGRSMKRIVALLVVLSLLAPQAGVLAGGQDAKCQALIENCLALFKEKGREAALAAINNPRGPYVRADLYVFALSLENVMLAHPHDKSLRGINLTKVRDSNGHRFFEQFGEIATSTGSGWVEYTWNKPGDGAPSKKRSYIKRVPNEDVYIGCGYYLN